MTNFTEYIFPSIRSSSGWLLAAILIWVFPSLCHGQFYQAGDNPSGVKWHTISTDNFRIVYPSGMDSTARVYGRILEKYRKSVGATAGFLPGEKTRGKVPVILHAYTARSNGSVAWAPKRMDLYTSPDAYASDFVPWHKSLAIHESRHVAQMQTGLSGIFRPFNYIFGEMFNGLVIGLYPPKEMLEGDAVVAETALTYGGRGRTADFLNYYMIAFDQGDFRNWNKWRFGSQKNYTPSYYAAGYLMFGGIRFLYGVDDFVGQYFHHITKRPYDILGFGSTLKKTAGRPIRKAFVEIADTLNRIWRRDIDARRPFTGTSPVVSVPKFYTTYSATTPFSDGFFTVKTTLAHPAVLVKTDLAGKEKYVRAFSSEVKKLSWDGASRLYWSEPVPDARWSLKVNSRIRFYDTEKGRAGDLTKKGRLYHPAVSEDGRLVCAIEYKDDTRTRLVFIDPSDRRTVIGLTAPDSLQLVECAFLDGSTVAVSAVSEGGFGIYAVEIPGQAGNDGEIGGNDGGIGGNDERERKEEKVAYGIWNTVLEPVRAIVRNLRTEGGRLTFSCDRTGVMELYSLDPVSGEVRSLTSNRYGADDFAFTPSGDTLLFSAKTYHGNLLVKSPADSLQNRLVQDFHQVHKYAIAEELTRQETVRALKGKVPEYCPSARKDSIHNEGSDDIFADTATVRFSEPRRYRKFLNLMRIHSWAPVYFNIDNIMSFSGEHFYDFASLGVAALSQNDLGTMVSNFGYSAHKDPYDRKFWRHSGHLTFTYSGWYPVIEASIDVNDRSARTYSMNYYYRNGKGESAGYGSFANGNPYISGRIRLYIPFNLSSGGWLRSLVPSVSYTVTNDIFNLEPVHFNRDDNGFVTDFRMERGDRTIRHYFTASAGFSMRRPVTNSGVYPRWGFGITAGLRFQPKLGDWFSPAGFVNAYAYFPGIVPQQGLYLKVLCQAKLNRNAFFSDVSANTLPRGIENYSAVLPSVASLYGSQTKISAEYGIPIYIGDLSVLGTFMYIKRLLVTPHFDYTFLGWKGNGLLSAGATFAIDFSDLLWLEFPFQIGVTYSFNAGNAFNSLKSSGLPLSRHYVGPVFSIDF